ncbi:MAG: hypothetical protein ACYDG3_12085 [Bacillati bacterium]
MHYPNGNRAIEVVGIEGGVLEHIELGRGLINISLKQLPKLQPLVNDFYEVYMKVKAMEGK